jgi:hypothetical protein
VVGRPGRRNGIDPMSRRRVAFAAIAVVTVLCVVGVSILAVASGGSALAYQVNGSRTSQHDFDQQLDDIVGTKGGKSQSHTEGSISSTTAAQVLQSNIVLDLLRGGADDKGVKVTAADRAAADQQIGTQLQGAPSSYQELQREIYAHIHALGLTSDAKVSAFLARAIRNADIYVNPRYGRWSPKFGVCPPTGCVAASSGSSG